MTCTRCQGLLLREHLPGHGRWWWKCLLCGERVDRTILLHRAEQEAVAADLKAAKARDLKEWAAWFATAPTMH